MLSAATTERSSGGGERAGQEVEALLDRALELLVMPTLENLRALEDILREATVRMPSEWTPEAGEKLRRSIAKKVRMCGRLLASAEAGRPGFEPPAEAYSPQGSPEARRGGPYELNYEA